MPRSRVAWWTVGGLLGAILAYVLWSFVGTFIFGVFIYYSTRPVYRRLKGRIRPPSLAAAVALFLLGLPVILLLSYTVAVSLQEVDALLVRIGSEGPITDMLSPYIDVSSIVQDPQQILESEGLRPLLESLASDAPTYLGFIANGALHLFVMIAIAFYLLRDDHRLSAWFRTRFADGNGVVLEYIDAIDRDFSNIFFGNILNAFLTGIIGAVSYNLLDYFGPMGLSIPYPTLLGLLTGAASLIPVIGMKLIYVPVAAFLFYDAWTVDPELFWFPTAFVLLSFVVVDTIPDFVLRPYVSGRGLHIGMVMFAYILGPLLFGWPGIFLGPVLLVLTIHFAKIVLPELVAGLELRGQPVGSRGEPSGGSVAHGTAGGQQQGQSSTATEVDETSGEDGSLPESDTQDPAEDSS